MALAWWEERCSLKTHTDGSLIIHWDKCLQGILGRILTEENRTAFCRKDLGRIMKESQSWSESCPTEGASRAETERGSSRVRRSDTHISKIIDFNL